MEIFAGQTGSITRAICNEREEFDMTEFGPGDCSKSKHKSKGL